MDLEKLNKTYEKAKTNIETKKREIEKLEKDLKTEMENIDIVKGAKIVAQRKNDTDAIKRADDAIKQHQENIKKIKEKAEDAKEEMQTFQEKVDKVVEEIKENPEMKEHLEQVLAKRYSREIKKTDKEIEELTKKKEENAKKLEEEDKKIENVDKVQKLVDEHPTMKNHMQGMLNASVTIQTLNDELATLDMVNDKKRIKEIQKEMTVANKKLDTNRDALLAYASKNKLGITKETLENIANNAVVDKKTKEVNVKASLSNTKKTIQANKDKIAKENKSYDKKIAGCNKQISHNEKAITKLGYRVPERENETERTAATNTTSQNTVGEEAQVSRTEDEPKPWQIIKRIKQWFANKKRDALPDPEQPRPAAEEEKSEFSQSLKYTVVQDIAKEMQKETVKEVKREEKEQNNER